MWRQRHPIFIRFDTIPACDRQTDRNATANTALSIAVHHKTCSRSVTQLYWIAKCCLRGGRGPCPRKTNDNILDWNSASLFLRFYLKGLCKFLCGRCLSFVLKCNCSGPAMHCKYFDTTRKGNHSSFWHQQWLLSDAPFGLKFGPTSLRKMPTATDFRLVLYTPPVIKITALEHASRGLSAIARATYSVLAQSACDLLKVL